MNEKKKLVLEKMDWMECVTEAEVLVDLNFQFVLFEIFRTAVGNNVMASMQNKLIEISRLQKKKVQPFSI